MAHPIMRWSKVTSQDQANKATGHNYRKDKVLNADEQAPHPNIELVNTARRGYWELAEERIAQVVTRKVRDDQVRCMEVILTASPEFFERDKDGRAVDMSNSQWAKDQLTFLEKTFGKENVLSCTLHQDEKSPHFHAVIAPITEDGRLSAKLLFNPITMTGYQTQYAEAMAVHGLVRGVEHSQAEHQPMKRMYGQQAQTAAELGAQLGPANSYQDVQVKRPGAKDVLNLSQWEAETSAKVNQQARAQVEEANRRAEKAQNLALENAAAKDQVRVLQKQLSTSEELKEANYEKFKTERAKVDDIAMRLAGGEMAGPKFIKRGGMLLDKAVQDVQLSRERIDNLSKEADQAEKKGDYGRVAELRYGLISNEQDRQQGQETHLRGYKGGAERLDHLNAQQAQERADKVQKQVESERQAVEQARLVQEAAEQKRIEQANLAAEQVRVAAEQKAENERQKPIIRENERQRIEEVSNQILRKNPHIYEIKYFVQAAEHEGIKVENPEKGSLILSIAGSANQFSHTDLKPGGEDFGKVFNQSVTNNNTRFDREQEREQRQTGNDQERD